MRTQAISGLGIAIWLGAVHGGCSPPPASAERPGPETGCSIWIWTAVSNGKVGTPLRGHLIATGGAEPYRFEVTTGLPPQGVMVAPGGQLTGTPYATGSYSFVVTATDAHGCTGSKGFFPFVVSP